jgi:hypothetical protein
MKRKKFYLNLPQTEEIRNVQDFLGYRLTEANLLKLVSHAIDIYGFFHRVLKRNLKFIDIKLF